MKIVNPATETVLQEVQEDSAATIDHKFRNAKAAQNQWAGLSLGRRVECVARFKQAAIDKRETLAKLLTEEVGKPIAQSRNELNGLLGRLDFFMENVENATADEVVFTDESQTLKEIISHEPLGVVANISAWNYPYFVGANAFIPALLTGNAVLYKPSEFATLTGLAIADLLHASGVPKEIFTPVIGGGVVGGHLLNHDLNGVFFTGSYGTGRKVAELAARRLMKTQLELGGKDPVYVCDDIAAIPAVAAAVADGAFYNTGQSCCSVERVYVHARIYQPFVDAFVKTVQDFKVGDPLDEKTYIGPVTRPAHLAYLDAQVADARAKGAKLVLGGQRLERKGYYYAPTVFLDVNHEMDLMREETFGPLIGIQRVKDDTEALELMNDTAYGLTASVYSKDKDRARRLLGPTGVGSAYWNCCDRVSPRLPWSGRGHSGLGTTLSKYGIQAFTQTKAWHLKG